MSYGYAYGKVFYGIAWQGEDRCDNAGNPLPWSKYSEETVDEYLSGLVDKGRLTEETSDVILLGEHCRAEAAMCFVAYISPDEADIGYAEAARGWPVCITDMVERSQRIEADAKPRLQEFCKAAGFDFNQLVREGQVGWWLVSYTEGG